MTIQEKLEPLTRWTEADAQQWCRENPFERLGGSPYSPACCLVAVAATKMAGVRLMAFMGPRGVAATPDEAVKGAYHPISRGAARVEDLFDSAVGGKRTAKGLYAIEAAALMWPEVFADEAKRLVQSVDAKHAVEVAEQ